MFRLGLLSILLLAPTFAQEDDNSLPASNTLPTTGTSSTSILHLGGDVVPTGPGVSYLSISSTRTLNTSGEIPLLASTTVGNNGSSIVAAATTSGSSTSSIAVTLLQGSRETDPAANNTAIGNNTSSRTSSSAQPTNTQPCNNYPEFCNRKYSNITEVAAHNSPFVAPNNAAANQALNVFDQLNDGVRMLTGQTHLVNGTMYFCHTTCDLLNSGTAEDYFRDIVRWVRRHPYDVVTLLIGNGDLIKIHEYIDPLEKSGINRYAFVPPKMPMRIDDWPTLSEMILMQKRIVIWMDYNADQLTVPYVMDEFSQMWETPFSPTNRSFPCTQERPPDLSREDAVQRLYLANHNLNTQITLAGFSLLVATVSLLNETNSVSGYGSLGLMADECSGACPKVHQSESESGSEHF
ncbi:MAG: hypothetical protein Q9183_000451 [Haloplaca sp. 2 TL-2023]